MKINSLVENFYKKQNGLGKPKKIQIQVINITLTISIKYKM